MAAGWEGQAACRGLDPALFYPAKGDAEQEVSARSVCARCPVVQACLTSALNDEKRLRPSDREGIRGGLDGHERYVLQHGEPKPRRRKKPVRKRPVRRLPRKRPERRLAPCGTLTAYNRHVRRGERIDAACAAERSAYFRSKRVPAVEQPECGTRSGYLAHTAKQEIPCEPCTRAGLAVTWFIRQGWITA
ncbi:hypothetical protein GT346_41565 [Streptomyces sp. SID161]|nr:hypothetical protein [Streptomyces sp. SID161]